MIAPTAPQGVRILFADGSERVPDAMLYAGKTHWLRWRPRSPRLHRWEIYIEAVEHGVDAVGFTAELMPGRSALTFHIRYRS